MSDPQSQRSPYRNEVDALRERKESLEKEIARLESQTSELETLRAQKQDLERELGSVADKLGAQSARRTLPLLDNVKVASPCNASWDEMLGDDRVRFCLSCDKNVFNLSAMSREEGEQLLSERVKGELCIRFFQRADGTILTTDCPVGVKKKRRKKLALAVAGAGAMAFAATAALTRGATCVQGERDPIVEMQGQMVAPPPPPQTATPIPDPTPDPPEMREMKGDWAGPAPTPTVKPPPPKPTSATPPPKKDFVMGRR